MSRSDEIKHARKDHMTGSDWTTGPSFKLKLLLPLLYTLFI
jgi:hypothetical protein